MSGHMTAQRLARLLTEMPRGTIIILGPTDKMYFGPSTQSLAGHVDFQREELVMNPATMAPTNDGELVAIEDKTDAE